MVRIGIVGGSSLLDFDPTDEFKSIGLSIVSNQSKEVTNEHGSAQLKVIQLASTRALANPHAALFRGETSSLGMHTLIFMQRHGHGAASGKITPPHKINHRANMNALHEEDVDFVVATSSVGTIFPSFPPATVGVATQYIDFSGIVTTFHHEDAKFTSVTDPFDPQLNAALLASLRQSQVLESDANLELTYWLSNGPQYETAAEVTAAERLGAHVCGMTAVREAKLCRELDLPYAALLIASNWAAGRHPGDASRALTHSEVSETSRRVTGTIVTTLVDLLKADGHHNGRMLGRNKSPETTTAGEKVAEAVQSKTPVKEASSSPNKRQKKDN